MTGISARGATYSEGVVGDLTDAALEVAARHGVAGWSVDQELELWHALENVARKPRQRGNLVAELTDAAYGVALGHGFRDPFDAVQLDLWRTLCTVWRRQKMDRNLV